MTLDISERKLSLKYPDVYDLKLSLPYPVDDAAGSAKYEKNSQSLVVTLPVKASAIKLPPRRSVHESRGDEEEKFKAKEESRKRTTTEFSYDGQLTCDKIR